MYGRKDLSSFVKGEELTTTVIPAATIPSEEDKVVPFKEPDWIASPKHTAAYIEVIKSGEAIDKIQLGKKATVLGRNADVCDVVLDHPSSSRKHAAIVHHKNGKLYLIDLQSGHGTFVDEVRIKPNSPMSLKEGMTIRFGASSRLYVVHGVEDAPKKRHSDADGASEKKRKIDSGPDSVRCRHILVKHAGSRNPSSWKDPKITRSKEDAIRIVKEYRDQIVSGNKIFETLATTASDCSSAKRGGDLGQFTRGKMQKAFEDASFALEVGEVSGIVDSASGIHIIKRIE